jgi:hypothetical protein
MVYHRWEDDDFDFREFNEVVDFVQNYLKTRRVPVRDVKEKYGSLRVYTGFGYENIHSFLYPGYAYCQYRSKVLWELDCKYGSKAMWLVNFIVIPLHKYWYHQAYKLALKKWPKFRDEILETPDYIELLEGL